MRLLNQCSQAIIKYCDTTRYPIIAACSFFRPCVRNQLQIHALRAVIQEPSSQARFVRIATVYRGSVANF